MAEDGDAGLAVAAVITGAAMKPGGAVAKVSPEKFLELFNKFREKGIVIVHGRKGVLAKTHIYVTGVHGVIFFCESSSELPISVDVEAKKISLGYV